MRLFVAINFNTDVKNMLYKVMADLQESTSYGKFSKLANLHLTLAFIGETNQAEAAKQAMDAIQKESFQLAITGIGSFQRGSGDIFWMGAEQNETLTAIQRELTENLIQKGFPLEQRDWVPHLTLAREVITPDHFNLEEFSKSIPKIHTPVNEISLMKSERIKGRLTYTEIHHTPLQKRL